MIPTPSWNFDSWIERGAHDLWKFSSSRRVVFATLAEFGILIICLSSELRLYWYSRFWKAYEILYNFSEIEVSKNWCYKILKMTWSRERKYGQEFGTLSKKMVFYSITGLTIFQQGSACILKYSKVIIKNLRVEFERMNL